MVLIYMSRYLNQETAKWPFWSSSQGATCYYQAISLNALPKDTTSKLAFFLIADFNLLMKA